MSKYLIEISDKYVTQNDEGLFIDVLCNEDTPEVHRYNVTPCEEPEELKHWRAEVGNPYFYVTLHGHIYIDYERHDEFDDWRYCSGNYFKTEEEAEEYKEKLIVYNELKAYAESPDAVWDDVKAHWYIFWHTNEHNIRYTYNTCYKLPVLYFSSRELAEKAVEAIGEDRVKKYYLGVKED